MIFFAALIGSIFGFMQSFGALMALTEKYIEKINERRSEKKNIRTVKKSRKALFETFDRKHKTKKSSKRLKSYSILPKFELKIT